MVSYIPFQQNSLRTHTESSRRANNDTLALDLLGKVDLVTGGILDQHVEVRNGVSLLHEGGSGLVEEGPLGDGTGEAGCETTSGEHDGVCWGFYGRGIEEVPG